MDSKKQTSLNNLELGRKRTSFKRLKRQSWARLKHLKQSRNQEECPLPITTEVTETSKSSRPPSSLKMTAEDYLRNDDENGFEAVPYPGKGMGLRTTRSFEKGEYLIEYVGDLITGEEGEQREKRYEEDSTIGSFLLFFSHNEKRLCIDATENRGKLARWANHSRRGNAKMRICEVDGCPRMYLKATKNIAIGEEILYDYGDRDPSSLEKFPWLKD